MLDVLQDALGTLPQESGASPHSGNGALARKLLERETFALTHAPHRLQVAEAVARRLEELLPTDPAACLEALRQLPQWTAFLQAGPLPAGDASQSHLAARRLRALATHLDSRLRRHVGEESVGATHALLELCDWLEALPMQEHVPDEAAWRELRHGGWDMAPLLARLDEELLRLRREVDKRAEQLRQRFLGSRGEDGQALPWVLEQLALDPAPPEQWLWLHHSLQRQARRLLGQLGLESELLPYILRPGLVPGCCDPLPASNGSLCGLGDLSALDGLALSRHLAWASHTLPALQVVREGLPGRAWLLKGCVERQLDEEDSVVAALVRPEDGDCWARWAADWMLRTGWQAGDGRLRLAQALLEAWELVLARADVELHLGIRPAQDVKKRLLAEGGVPAHVVDAAWQILRLQPGRFALASARLLLWREAGRRWRRNHREAGTADWFRVLARCALFPLAWQKEHLAAQLAEGRSWKALPPALVRPISPRGDGLLTEMEERLATLGRIRREDIEAGREFDTQATPSPSVAVVDEMDTGGDDEATA